MLLEENTPLYGIYSDKWIHILVSTLNVTLQRNYSATRAKVRPDTFSALVSNTRYRSIDWNNELEMVSKFKVGVLYYIQVRLARLYKNVTYNLSAVIGIKKLFFPIVIFE